MNKASTTDIHAEKEPNVKTPTAAIISLATELLPIEGTTLDTIHDAIRKVAGLNPAWLANLDHKAAVAELARRRNVALPLDREAIEKLLTFDVNMSDGTSACPEWTGPALDLLTTNSLEEGTGETVLEALEELARLPAGSSVPCGFFHLTRLPSNDADSIENDDSEGVRVFAEYDDGDGLDSPEGIDTDLDDDWRGMDSDQRAERRQMGFSDF